MAAGVCLMAHGALPDDRGKWNSGQDKTPPPWDYNIVHRDIKPQNYFLSTPSDSIVWPELPITALADFGNAFDAAGPQYTNKPRLARGMGKPLWEAPEQHNDSPDLYTVSSATNVYQIGLSILQMMHLQWPVHETSFSDPRRRPIYPGTAPLYPQRLVDLAQSCVAIHPADRPSPEEIYRSVRKLAMGSMEYEGDGSHRIPWRKWISEGPAAWRLYANILALLEFQRAPQDELLRTVPDKYAAWFA
jgi:serine/threonine protein kinase